MKSFSRFQYSTILLPVSVVENENSELLSAPLLYYPFSTKQAGGNTSLVHLLPVQYFNSSSRT
jgi:hypothetical protein